jgi:hypothetical protein
MVDEWMDVSLAEKIDIIGAKISSMSFVQHKSHMLDKAAVGQVFFESNSNMYQIYKSIFVEYSLKDFYFFFLFTRSAKLTNITHDVDLQNVIQFPNMFAFRGRKFTIAFYFIQNQLMHSF